MGCGISKSVHKSTLPRSPPKVAKCESPDAGRVKSKSESMECRAFRKCFADLSGASGIMDPSWLADQLYSRELIGPDLRRAAHNQAVEGQVKTDRLLSAVENQIMACPATTFDDFLDVLHSEPSLHSLAIKLENTLHELESVSQPISTPSSLPIDTYATYLKSVYTREKPPIYDKWPRVKSKKYINLALIEKEDITKPEADQFTRATIHGNIDDIKKSKRATNIKQIAQLPDGSQPKCILVEGAPGVGKSTFAWKLCRKWGKGKLLKQYQVVVLLRLRDKNVRAATNISNLFRYHDHHIQREVVEEIQKNLGKGVLLLFEGYDELPEELRTNNSIFLDVITRKELPEATVLITSRSWASEFLRRECKENISQHIEILGFTKDNIQFYLESSIPDDSSLLADLQKYISCYPHINSLMYIPLNSAIVLEVYQNSRKDETLVPKTMTELYSSLVRSLLLRHLLDHPVHGKKRDWNLQSFNDLPQDVYQQLCELGKLAYEGICNDQQVIFHQNDFKTLGLSPKNFETLVMMQRVQELYADEGAAISYNFLHLTVQEYLAAFHLAQQPEEKQVKHFQEYMEVKQQQRQHFHMALRFLCGLRKFSPYLSEVILNLLHVDNTGDNLASGVTFDTLHWLFEAQENDAIAKLLGSSNIQLCKQLRTGTPFDCFVLGYCVSQSNCTWKIKLFDCHIGDEGVEMLVRGAVEKKTHCKGQISEINFTRNDITSEGLKHLLNLPKQLINKLETLNLRDIELDSECCATLANLIPRMPHLKKLVLCDDPNNGQRGAVPLITSLTARNSLEELRLGWAGIGVKDCQALNELLSSSTSLKKLCIGDYHLLPETIELIISGLYRNTTLRSLELLDSHFSIQNTSSLASVLKTNHTLVHLNLFGCNIDSVGACQLASALRKNDTLQELHLWGNPIGVAGAAAFAKMLFENKSLKLLNLQHDSIGEEGTQKLIDSLTHNATVEKLWLPNKYKSSITSSGVDSRVNFSVWVHVI